MNDDALKQLRAQIDAIDDQLLALWSERARLAQAVGHAKNGAIIYRPEREAQIVRRLCDANPGPLPGEVVERLIRETMSACRALEQAIHVAYLGPAGTFSQQAVVKQFGQGVDAVPEADIDACFRAVESGRAHFAVVPAENSTEGSVTRTLDLMLGTPLKIIGEVLLPIHQNLMRTAQSSPGATDAPSPLAGEGWGEGGVSANASPSPQPSPLKGEGANDAPCALSSIRAVYGHPQSLAQCQHWLAEHLPGAQKISVVSNSEAARRAAAEPDAASLGSATAAPLYGLEIIAANIEDEANNTTRFWVLGPSEVAPSGRDRTSLAVGAPNVPGAVVKLLQPLADAGISMSKLESRPAKSGQGAGGNWEYVFHVVCEGHRADPGFAAVLGEVERRAAFLKVLGSYPASTL